MISQGIKTSCKLGVVLGLLLLVGAGERSFTVIAGGEPGTLTTWTVPTPNPGLEGIAVSPSGEVYFAEFSGNKIGQLDPLSNTITEWLAGQGPRYLALGPSGEVYFTESAGDRISRLMPSHGFYSSEGVPTGGSQPLGIAVMTGVGSVSKIWFTEKLAGKLGALTLGGFVFDVVQPAPSGQQVVSPTTTALTPIVNTVSPRITPGNPALPPGIAAPPATTSGPFTEWQLLGSGQPRMLAVAPDGSLWISTETRSLLKFEPSSGTLTFYDLPMGSVSLDVAVDAVGNVWFTENYANKIGRLNPQNGDVTEWPLPGGGQPFALAIAPDGSVWFTEREGDRIGHLEPWSHTITEYQLPTGVHPLDIAVDAVGDVWFTTERAGTVNRLSIGPVLGPPPAPPGTDAILSVTVTPISATEADVTVEYSYSGSQGLPVFVGAWPTQGGGRAAEFGYVPARIDAPGTGTVTVRVKYSGSGCVSTDGLDVFLYDSGGTVFLTQNFPYAMQWQCAVGPPLPPPPPPAPAGLPTVNLQIDRGCGANYNPGDALIISISVSEAANVTLLDFDTSQRIQQFALGTLTPGLTRTITGTVTGPAGVETLVAVARTASGIYVSTGCSFSIGGVSLSLVSLTLDRGCDGLYHYGETATVTLNSSVTGWATLFNVTRTGQIKQLFLGRPIQAGVPLQLTAPIEAITGRSTLVAYVRDASGRNVTTWCSMNVLP